MIETTLLGLLLLMSPVQDLAARAARDVMATFCRLDTEEGAQLMPARWREIAALFTRPGSSPRLGPIVIVRDCAVGDATLRPDDAADVMVECIELGMLDEKPIRFGDGRLPPGGVKMRHAFTIVRTPGSASRTTSWKIEGPVPPPTLTAEAAIRYVTALRDASKDTKVIRNANLALAGLKLQIGRGPRDR